MTWKINKVSSYYSCSGERYKNVNLSISKYSIKLTLGYISIEKPIGLAVIGGSTDSVKGGGGLKDMNSQ